MTNWYWQFLVVSWVLFLVVAAVMAGVVVVSHELGLSQLVSDKNTATIQMRVPAYEEVVAVRERFKRQLPALSQSVVGIFKAYKMPDSENMKYAFVGSGFAVNESTIAIPPHIPEGMGEDPYFQGLIAGFTFSGTSTFVALDNLTNNGVAAYYTLFEEDAEKVRGLNIGYPCIDNLDNLYAGQIGFFITPNLFHLDNIGLPYGGAIIVSPGKTIYPWSAFAPSSEDKWEERMLSTLMTAMPGDSGAPVFIFGEESKEFCVAGMVEMDMFISRSDVMADFLRENNINFRE